MARFRPAGSGSRRTTAARSNKGLIPCVILIILGFALIFLLMYEVMKSGK
ncbi:MAG TPA: hypothetical protein VK419_00545 [Bryobacteraceae bacterium]|nr:hypothetical protein [Bryobacteraceae bacterium]